MIMKKSLLRAIMLIIVLSTSTLASHAQQVTWPEVTREAKAGSRWWWMGSAVDEENLRWNMAQYAAAGFGTLEITPIYGVNGNAARNIPFLSDRWLAILQYTQQ